MKKPFTLFLFIAATSYFLSCVHDPVITLDRELLELLDNHSQTGSFTYFRMPESTDYASLPFQDAKNPVTEAKVELGKLLFFETGIGLAPKYPTSSATYSCATCHIPTRGFTAGRFQGIADGGIGFGDYEFGSEGSTRSKNPIYDGEEVDAQGARPLPTINLTYVTNALWAGTFGSFYVNEGTEFAWNQDTLVAINFKGLQGLESNNARALIVHRQVINKDITDSLGYTPLFDIAFPDIPENQRYTIEVGAMAIAAYFRTILTNQAPFQRYLKGDNAAMSDQQKRGAILFFDKAGCINCHNSPSLNGSPHEFYALGVNDMYQHPMGAFATGPDDKRNFGRGGFTGKDEDMFKFKVPQLYNLKDFGFYFHGASKTSLRDVVEYFNDAIPENTNVPADQISGFFRPLNLTEDEKQDLIEFLEHGLRDPNLLRYMPGSTMSGNCFPNNDALSKSEMGCD